MVGMDGPSNRTTGIRRVKRRMHTTGWIESLSAGTSLRTADMEVRRSAHYCRCRRTINVLFNHTNYHTRTALLSPPPSQQIITRIIQHQQVFKLSLSLTKEGLTHTDDIIALVRTHPHVLPPITCRTSTSKEIVGGLRNTGFLQRADHNEPCGICVLALYD